MKKKILSFLTMLCMATALLVNITTVSAYTEAEYGDYLYYTVSDDKVTISYCDRSATEIKIPSTIAGYPVTSIGGNAFSFCENLTSITIPDSVTSIGYCAFYCCTGLTSVTISNSVTSIGLDTFSYCSSLTSVTIPDSVTNIDFNAFHGCTGLTSVTIPDSVTSIGYSAFAGCDSLTSVTISDSVTSIDFQTFYYCTSLTSVIIPNSVTSIGKQAFSGCTGLTSVTIPDSVTSIGDSAFSDCTGLTSVTIPDSVTSISGGAFYGCNDLKTVYYKGTEADWNKIIIEDYNAPLKNASIVYLKNTKTTVSENGKKFTVTLKNIASGNTVILALYNGDTFVEIQSKPYTGEAVPPFTTDKTYTNAKVMIWGSLSDMIPICVAEIIE